MGFFNFSKYSKKEKAVLDEYAQMNMMMGLSISEAKKIAKEMLDMAIEMSKKEGSYYLPQNMGDIILGDADTDNPIIKKVAGILQEELPRKREEGVRDEDIRWWWNLNNVERMMMIVQDNGARLALFTHEMQNSTETSQENTDKKAAAKVRKFHPLFGNPDDNSLTDGDDRPLPHELKDRINIYIEKRVKTDIYKYKQEIEQSTTFNALIRKEIRAGKI
jgi:hypothetical protein